MSRLMPVNRDALETFALSLVRTASPSGEEGAVAALVRAELERWAKVAKAANLKPE